MGSTIVEFRGAGFEASDAVLEVWLHLLVAEIDTLPQVSPWLKEVREDWHIKSVAGFSHGIMPDLDAFVTDEERRGVILALSERALQTLEQWGETVSKDALNRLRLGGEGSSWTADVPTEVFLRAGRYFVKLLRGELSPEENDARLWPSPGSGGMMPTADAEPPQKKLERLAEGRLAALGDPRTDPLAVCWELVVRGISYGELDADDVQTLLDNLSPSHGCGFNVMGFEPRAVGRADLPWEEWTTRMQVHFLRDEASCPFEGMMQELQRLQDAYRQPD